MHSPALQPCHLTALRTVVTAAVITAGMGVSSPVPSASSGPNNTDEKVACFTSKAKGCPNIPCRSEDQQKRSVDSFQLAKTLSRTNPH